MKRRIYGVSSKFDFGFWEHVVFVFDDINHAQEWLETETYNFNQRELMTKTAAIRLAGKKAVENAIEYTSIL